MLLVRMYIGTSTMKMVWRFLKKSRIEQLYDPSILLLGINLKNMKTIN